MYITVLPCILMMSHDYT